MSQTLPSHEGFYWAKWMRAAPGTDRCRSCNHKHSEWEDKTPIEGEDWAVVEVVENCIDHKDPDHLMVQVGGVSQWQRLKDFQWGPEVARP